jgi:hypothetical protein
MECSSNGVLEWGSGGRDGGGKGVRKTAIFFPGYKTLTNLYRFFPMESQGYAVQSLTL